MKAKGTKKTKGKPQNQDNSATLLFLFSIFVFLAAIFVSYTANQLAFTADAAFSFAVADHSLHGHLPLLGPPSHTGGRHLGPFYYYLTTIIYLVSGKSIFLSHLFYSLILCLGLGVWGYLFYRIVSNATESKFIRTKFTFIAGSIFLACLLTPNFISLFRYYWQPHFFLFITPLFVLTLIRFSERRPHALLEVLVSASCMIQIHYGAVPLVIAGILAFGCLRGSESFDSESDEVERNSSGLFKMLLFFLLWCLWLPALYYELVISGNFLETVFPHITAIDRGGQDGISVHNFILSFLEDEFSFFQLASKLPFHLKWVVCIPLLWPLSFFLKSEASKNTLFLRFVSFSLISFLAYSLLLAYVLKGPRTYYMYPLLCLAPFVFAYVMATFLSIFQSYAGTYYRFWIAVFAVFISVLSFEIIAAPRTISFYSLATSEQIASVIPKQERNVLIDIHAPKEFPILDSIRFFIGPTQYVAMKGWDAMREFSSSSAEPTELHYGATWEISCGGQGKTSNDDSYKVGKCVLAELKAPL